MEGCSRKHRRSSVSPFSVHKQSKMLPRLSRNAFGKLLPKLEAPMFKGFKTSRILLAEKAEVKMSFILPTGEVVKCVGKEGDSVLDVAHANDVDLEGACEQSLACSTCHVYVDKEFFPKLPSAEEEELDMLDLAIKVKDNSRLGCQIILNKKIDGIVVTVPAEHSNMLKS
eukprot:TRINITY_DN1094_c0_g1_i2.p1 TRINITY_DN1094_c0_g1~~TRINITY_DN1094_c0_g1_i2.p1  ORF type:complete len:170 (-),score=14.49 TRINITY_DN1094_c0_g1_i2:454-963(-)